MNKKEIAAAIELLADRTQRTETIALDGGGLALSVTWVDGGQKIFYSLEGVRDHVQYA